MDKKDLIECIDNTSFINNLRVSAAEDCIHKLGDLSTQFTVLTQNIRSAQKNFDQFLVFLERLNFQPDLIILTECWINDTFVTLDLPNYTCYHSKIFLNQNDGLIVFSRSNISVEVQEPVFHDANCLIINVASTLLIIAIYRSPALRNISTFLNSLESAINIASKFESSIIIGDLNIDIKLNNLDPKSYEYLELTSFYGYLAGNLLPTRGSNCLDHALIKTNKPSCVIVCDSDITDHDTVIVCINQEVEKTAPLSAMVTKINFIQLVADLEIIDWSILFLETDVDRAAELLVDTINCAISNNSYTLKPRNSEIILKPWLTKGLLNCIRRRDRLHLYAKNFPNNEYLQQRYKKCRNNCQFLLQTSKNNYESEQIKSSKGNSKKLWTTVKTICNFKTEKSNCSKLVYLKTNKADSLNLVNDYFVSVGKDLAHAILQNLNKTECNLATSISATNQPTGSLYLTPTDAFEIMSIISKLKTSSATSHDKISNNILKQAKLALATPIAYLCNLSMLSGMVPRSFKVADVCPIFKSGDALAVSNYRPISLLPSLSKILEKVVNKRLLGYLEKYNLLSENQFGFRSQRSTEDAVVALVDSLTRKLDVGRKCIGIFLDLAKAFDTVSWPILIRKLEMLGVRGIPLKWFQSYLSDRKQRVKINEDYSDYAQLSFGVPQGSVLGPTLFLVYINDLCSLDVKQADIFTFADDTALIFNGCNWDEAVGVTQDGMRKVASWLQTNLLTLNASKTKYMAFSITQRSRPGEIKLKIHTCDPIPGHSCTCPEIQAVDSLRYLGVMIDHQLTWEMQIKTLCARIRKMIYIFKKLAHVADPQTIRIIYQTLCQSILNYCIVCWGSATKTLFLKVERAQRALLKVAFRKPYRYPTNKLYRDTNFLRVRQLYILAATLRFHKTSLYSLTEPARSSRRNTWKLPHTKTLFARRAFSYKGAYLYQFLDRLLNLIQDTHRTCKNKIISWLLSLDYERTEEILTVHR